MSVFQDDRIGQTLGYKWVYRVYTSEEGVQPEVRCTVSSPEEAGYMIEELREVYGDELNYWFSREREITHEADGGDS